MCSNQKRKNVYIILIMTKYTNGKIYKIVNDIDNEICVGSTVISLYIREKLNIK